MSRTSRVKCRVCVNENDGFCSVKKCKTRGNKPRICTDFVNDLSKVKIKQKVKTVMRPDWYWRRKEVKRAYKEALKKQEAEKQLKDILDEDRQNTPDCLASFRSTASDIGDDNSSNIDVINTPDCLANIRTTLSGVEEKNEF